MTTLHTAPSPSDAAAREQADLRDAIVHFRLTEARHELDKLRAEIETLAILRDLPARYTRPQAARAPLTTFLRREDHR